MNITNVYFYRFGVHVQPELLPSELPEEYDKKNNDNFYYVVMSFADDIYREVCFKNNNNTTIEVLTENWNGHEKGSFVVSGDMNYGEVFAILEHEPSPEDEENLSWR